MCWEMNARLENIKHIPNFVYVVARLTSSIIIHTHSFLSAEQWRAFELYGTSWLVRRWKNKAVFYGALCVGVFGKTNHVHPSAHKVCCLTVDVVLKSRLVSSMTLSLQILGLTCR